MPGTVECKMCLDWATGYAMEEYLPDQWVIKASKRKWFSSWDPKAALLALFWDFSPCNTWLTYYFFKPTSLQCSLVPKSYLDSLQRCLREVALRDADDRVLTSRCRRKTTAQGKGLPSSVSIGVKIDALTQASWGRDREGRWVSRPPAIPPR